MRKGLVFLFLAALVAAVPASAQDDRRVNVNLGGGFTFATGEVRNHLGDGYNVNAGLTLNITPMIGFQMEYSFHGLGEKQLSVPVSPTPTGSMVATPFYGNMNMQYGNFNLIAKPSAHGTARPYAVAGIGVYHRPVTVTTPALGYVPGYCDPFWYYCSTGGYVPVDRIIGTRSSTDFGFDVGGGVDFRVSEVASVYVEAKYHYMMGPSFTNPTTNATQKATGQYFPITIGVRF